MEIWKDIIGYDQYQVSNYGRVKTTANKATRKERILKPLIHPKGYFRVALWKDNKSKFFFIHRLVAKYFISNPENKPTINHIDGDKSNNHIDNLEWTTYRENMNHAIENRISACGERNGRSKLNWTQIEEIRSSHLTSDELAAIYSVHKSTINRIKRKEGWK